MAITLDGATLKRGDSYKFTVSISDGTISSTDTLQWIARRKVTDTVAVIEKSTANGGIVRISDTQAQITILPSDTSGLLKTTALVWEFQRTTTTGEVDTIILPDGETVGSMTIEVDLIRG